MAVTSPDGSQAARPTGLQRPAIRWPTTTRVPPEAIELDQQALELSPKDPFITDSLAWAQFRSGNHETALQLLRCAFKDKPDAEIAAHLGEALTQRFREAIRMSGRRSPTQPDNETLTETI